MDVRCAKCGEPQDSYSLQPGIYSDPEGHGDLTREEAERFLRGEGCPHCGYGTRCPGCNGTGRYTEFGCGWCHGKASVLAWNPSRDSRGYRADTWYVGYRPNVRELPKDAKVLRSEQGFDSADGWVNQRYFYCPDADRHPPCEHCKGTGKLKADEDLALKAAMDDCDSSDEDPFMILHRRGLI